MPWNPEHYMKTEEVMKIFWFKNKFSGAVFTNSLVVLIEGIVYDGMVIGA